MNPRHPIGWPKGSFMHQLFQVVDSQPRTLKELAADAGVTKNYLTLVRRAKINPTIRRVEAIIEACGDYELHLVSRK